ncbi:MAG TPA: anthranilate phosphoribosyltransferase, partial [Candidatus Binatia bacterium]|nr:anthranilate phosphoribosyltransferase [Candidatus Binatia bacterium]
GPFRDAVVYNAAAALLVAGRTASLREGAERAAGAIDAGRAEATLQRLVEITNLCARPSAAHP